MSFTRHFFQAAAGHYSIAVDQEWPPIVDNIAKLIQKGACGIISEANGTVGEQIFAGCTQYVGDPPTPLTPVVLNAGTNTTRDITEPLRCLISDINRLCTDNVSGYVIMGFFMLIAAVTLAAFVHSRYEKCNHQSQNEKSSRQRLRDDENEGEGKQVSNYGSGGMAPSLP